MHFIDTEFIEHGAEMILMAWLDLPSSEISIEKQKQKGDKTMTISHVIIIINDQLWLVLRTVEQC